MILWLHVQEKKGEMAKWILTEGELIYVNKGQI